MAKANLADWDSTPGNNTDIGGISLAENVMAPPAVNDAFRESMSQVADLYNSAVPFSTAQKNTFRANIGANLGVDTRRNRIVNGDMRVSQENGTSSGTANGYYPVDQWAQYRVTSAGTLTVQQVASVTPAGSPNRLRATVTVADASLAAGEYWTLTQNLEGSNVADFQYGGSAAKNIVLRFGFKAPAGTYAARLGNSAANRSYVALFTISAGQANTDTVQTISIAGDTTGTWLTADGVIGLTLDIVLACGSTFQGATGWQAGNILGTSAVTNGMGTGSAVFELFDVGLKLDPDATGVYGQYEVGEVDAVYRSERYVEKTYAGNVLPGSITENGGQIAKLEGSDRITVRFRVPKCKPPTGIWYSSGTGYSGKARDLGVAADIDCSTEYSGTNSITAATISTNGNLVCAHVVAFARLS